MKQRIQKLLAAAGVGSRRAVEQMILEGRVSVNGQIARTPPVLIDPASDQVRVDGEPVRLRTATGPRGHLYILLNKPKGVFTTNVAQGEQVRTVDLLPAELSARIYPVGRLDAASRGLVLMTNDGELTHRLTHARYAVPKVYRAIVDGYVTERTIADLAEALHPPRPADAPTADRARPIAVSHRSTERSTLELTLREGRNVELRKILAGAGHKVRELTRVKMGPLTLHKLGPGAYRPLTPREVRTLYDLTGLNKPAPRSP